MKRTPKHFSCQKGKLVRIVLVDGTEIIDRFVEKESKNLVLKGYGRIKNKDMSTFGIYRSKKHD